MRPASSSALPDERSTATTINASATQVDAPAEALLKWGPCGLNAGGIHLCFCQ